MNITAILIKLICSICLLIAAYNFESYRGWLVAAAIVTALWLRMSVDREQDNVTCPKCGHSFKVEE